MVSSQHRIPGVPQVDPQPLAAPDAVSPFRSGLRGSSSRAQPWSIGGKDACDGAAVAALSDAARREGLGGFDVMTARHRWGAPRMVRGAAGAVLAVAVLVSVGILLRVWLHPAGQVETALPRAAGVIPAGSPNGPSGGATVVPTTGSPTARQGIGAAGPPSTELSSAATVVVHVVGRVRRPGLVTLAAQARVSDAVQAAGGPAPGARLARINLARHVQDGEQIMVPDADDPLLSPGAGPSPSTPSGNATSQGGRSGSSPVNLNTASVAELDALPGIGPVLAQRIVDWRQAHGSFTRVEELREVEGIGASLLNRLRELVSV